MKESVYSIPCFHKSPIVVSHGILKCCLPLVGAISENKFQNI